MATKAAWKHPQAVDGIATVFGGDVDRLMPPMSEIPDEFHHGHTEWNRVQQDWFFRGLKGAEWEPKDGIDLAAALRHLKAIQSSWAPKHEHKEAAVAYLMSLWFDAVTYEAAR